MGMFSDLMNKIFHHGGVAERPYDASSTGAAVGHVAGVPGSGQGGASTATAAVPIVDVEAILDKLAAAHGEKLDWRHSIVDMMKLLDMDSSLAARKDFAADLHYTGDTHDTATMNLWLHKIVMTKLAENGGKVPADLIAR